MKLDEKRMEMRTKLQKNFLQQAGMNRPELNAARGPVQVVEDHVGRVEAVATWGADA